MREHESSGLRRRAWRMAWRAVVVGVLTVLLLEGILRVMGLATPVLYEADAEAGYRLRANQRARLLANTIHINAWGLRDSREFAAGPSPLTRVLVLGDSVTWGGARERTEELFTSVLESRLENAEVLNAGVNGYSITQMVRLYETRLRELQPDIVVVYAIPGDFERPPVTQLIGEHVAFPTRRPRSALWAALRVAQLSAHRRWGWPGPAPAAEPEEKGSKPDENVMRNIEALERLRDGLGENQRLIVIISPYREGGVSHALPEAVREGFVEMDMEWYELNERTGAALEMFYDHIHLSGEGHRKVGEALAEILRGGSQGLTGRPD